MKNQTDTSQKSSQLFNLQFTFYIFQFAFAFLKGELP